MNEPSKQQKNEKRDYMGIVGIVNIPYSFVVPTHNKQDLSDKNEHSHLILAMGEHLEQYLNDLNMTLDAEFWRPFGYVGWDRDLPSMELNYMKCRRRHVKMVAQCDRCLKWRTLPFNPAQLKPDFPPDNWICDDNVDQSRSK
jgi:MORC family CW-type zinc finger protein